MSDEKRKLFSDLPWYLRAQHPSLHGIMSADSVMVFILGGFIALFVPPLWIVILLFVIWDLVATHKKVSRLVLLDRCRRYLGGGKCYASIKRFEKAKDWFK
ncbi:hypothetical protein [Pokkaliibacter plantistimulans]|nr:hypothetical protein [Pokkaliibacter plantistimulans]